MSFEGDVRDMFGQAGQELTLEPGSLDAVKSRAQRRTNRSRMAAGAAVVAALVLIGGLFTILPNRDAPVATDDRIEDGAVGPDEQRDEGAVEPDSEAVDDAADDVVTVEGQLTEESFSYVGAFMVPSDGAEEGFSYGGRAAAFNPYGDPEGVDDFGGSMFITGFAINERVAEIAIPTPVPHTGSSAGLPIAEILQPLTDVTDGRGSEFIGAESVGGWNDYRIGGLEVVDSPDGPRLHWSSWQYQNRDANDLPSLGHSSLDLSNPDPQGPWYLDGFVPNQFAGYLFAVPDEFADSALSEQNLIVGSQEVTKINMTSAGPPFFSYEAPATAPVAERLSATELAYFPEGRELSGYVDTSVTLGAAWLETAQGRAIVTVGNDRALETGSCAEDDGSRRASYGPKVSFYEPADLAAVAAGEREPWQIEPYRTWDPTEHLIDACGLQISSISFDAESSRVYVVQMMADVTQNEFEPVAVIHVFDVR